MIYERTNKGTQKIYIDTLQKYQPTKHGNPVWIHTSARGSVYTELGAELKINEALIVGPAESFQQLLAEQPRWIWDLIQFVQFPPDIQKYNKIEKTIEDVLKAHDEDGYLIAVSDGSVKDMHQMSFRSFLLGGPPTLNGQFVKSLIPYFFFTLWKIMMRGIDSQKFKKNSTWCVIFGAIFSGNILVLYCTQILRVVDLVLDCT